MPEPHCRFIINSEMALAQHPDARMTKKSIMQAMYQPSDDVQIACRIIDNVCCEMITSVYDDGLGEHYGHKSAPSADFGRALIFNSGQNIVEWDEYMLPVEIDRTAVDGVSWTVKVYTGLLSGLAIAEIAEVPHHMFWFDEYMTRGPQWLVRDISMEFELSDEKVHSLSSDEVLLAARRLAAEG